MNTTTLRQIIKEAITDRLKMIDEAGDKAAISAKIAKIEEDIKEANDIKNAIPTNINQYVDTEIIGDLMDDMNNSIAELEAKKKELEEQLTSMDKPVKVDKAKKAEKPAKKKSKKLNEASFSSTDVNAILKSARAAVEAGKEVTVDGIKIGKVVSGLGRFIPADGSQSLKIMDYVDQPEKIVIDGTPATLKPMEPSKPQPDTRTPEEKAKAQAAFDDRYGPGGGYDTAFGRYTGD